MSNVVWTGGIGQPIAIGREVVVPVFESRNGYSMRRELLFHDLGGSVVYLEGEDRHLEGDGLAVMNTALVERARAHVEDFLRPRWKKNRGRRRRIKARR